MLRRHIRQSGAMADQCTELDIDTASAYLEGALRSSALVRFETHLADCRYCRVQLLELSGLNRASTQSAASVHPAISLSWWERLQNAAAGITGQLEGAVAGWRWNWTAASGALAACVVIAMLLVTEPWKSFVPSDNAGSNIAMERGETGLSSTMSRQDPGVFEENPTAVTNPETPASVRQRIPSPRIDLSPGSNSQTEPVLLARDLTSLSAGNRSLSLEMTRNMPPVPNTQSIQPPLVARQAEEFIPTRSSAQSLAASPVVITDNRGAVQSPPVRDGERPEMAPRINPLPDYNPMYSNSNRRPANRARNDKSTLRTSRPDWSDRVMGFMPIGRPDKKRSSDDEKELNEDLPAPMVRKLRDKTFSFENGAWIDHAYKPDLMYWRVIRLETGSREYERLLADDPQLREFFNLGQIIIVWRDKIYKVVNR